MEKPEGKAPGSGREGIEGLVTKLLEALSQHDATGCAALFTDEGSILSPYGAEVRGRDAIKATHEAWFDEGETNKRLDLHVVWGIPKGHDGPAVLVTAYRPDPKRWNETFTERKR